jgi:hypothetical protein
MPQLHKFSPEKFEEQFPFGLGAESGSPTDLFEIARTGNIGKIHSGVAEASQQMWDEGVVDLTRAPSMKVRLG